MSANRCLRRRSNRPVRRLRMERLEDRRLLAGWIFGIEGSGYEAVYDVAVDDDGNSYVAGRIASTVDFDPGPGSTLLSSDIASGFVAKYSSDKSLLWVRQLGESANVTSGDSIALDSEGNAYVAGWFRGTAQFGDTTLVSVMDSYDVPSRDFFVSKLDTEGEFQWAVRYGDVWEDRVEDIAVDDEGDVYLTGSFEDTIEFGDTSLTSEGWNDIFIAKLDRTDAHVLWAQRAGSTRLGDTGLGIVASRGDVYVAGRFYGTAQFGDTTVTGGPSESAFITKLDAASGDFVWAKAVGETQSERGSGQASELAVDSTGNVYVVGVFTGTAKFGQQELVTEAIAGFLTKVDGQGNFLWALPVGGLEWWAGIDGVVVHTDGTLHLTGGFKGTVDFDPGPGTVFRTSAGDYDGFVLELDAEGRYVEMWQMRALDDMAAQAIGVDPAGNCYVVGYFGDTVTFPDGTLTSAGSRDGFVVKLGDAVIHRIDAQTDVYNVDEDQTLDVPLPGVLENDTDNEDHMLTAALSTEPGHGTVTLLPDGSFTYEPAKDFAGTDSFSYVAGDGTIASNVTTVTITINPINDAPLAVDDTYTTDVNVALLPLAPGLLENDEDVDGNSLTAIIVTEPAHFLAFQLNSDGSFAYFPETDYQGPDSFTYKVNDGQADSNVATVTITVGNPRHPGDADLSGATDLSDFNIWNANKFTAGTDWARGDFNGDGITDLSDFNIWNAHKFTTAPAPVPLDGAVGQAAFEPAATIADLADLLTVDREDDTRQETESAVDLLLASYWQ